VEQVLDNFLSNALEVSPTGATIRVTAGRDDDGRVALHVVDQGPGMTDEQRARAFDRFWRGRSGDGSGLGLAIVRRLVEADGGEVELRAATPQGIDAVAHFPAA